MGLFRPSRERRGPDPHLAWKMALFTIGAAVGVIGMLRDNGRLIALGILLLAAGVLLRFLPHPRD